MSGIFLESPLSKLLLDFAIQDPYGSRRRPDRSRSMDGCWENKFRFTCFPEATQIIQIMPHLVSDSKMGHAKDTTTLTTRLKLGEEKNVRKSGKERTWAFLKQLSQKKWKKDWARHSCLNFPFWLFPHKEHRSSQEWRKEWKKKKEMEKRREGQPGTAGFSAKKTAIPHIWATSPFRCALLRWREWLACQVARHWTEDWLRVI